MKRVLIVDDDEDVLDAAVTVLGGEGYAIATAKNGQQALEILRTGPRPAVILLDLMMPVMDGYVFRERQLADPSIAGVPVVVVTAGDVDARARALRPAGCLTKPFDLDDLLRVIESVDRGS